MTTTALVVALAGVVGAFLSGLLGQRVTQKGLREADVWRRREETMRMLRWGAEKSVDADLRTADVGMAALEALEDSELLQDVDRALIEAVVDAVLERPLTQLAQSGGAAGVMAVPLEPREG